VTVVHFSENLVVSDSPLLGKGFLAPRLDRHKSPRMDEQATDTGMANSIVKETEGDIFGAPQHAVLMRKLLHRNKYRGRLAVRRLVLSARLV
jgi:hypothetical protein